MHVIGEIYVKRIIALSFSMIASFFFNLIKSH